MLPLVKKGVGIHHGAIERSDHSGLLPIITPDALATLNIPSNNEKVKKLPSITRGEPERKTSTEETIEVLFGEGLLRVC